MKLGGFVQTDPLERRPNRLVNEKSPYLIQHAYNPVDWFPWSQEAFEKARTEDRPIFLSIGYSTCHWCHVMEKESFEDSEVARLLNKKFVSIKVDREERPDLDKVYMLVCQLMTGAGGWPLTIIMTPDKRPFLAATYLPKERKFGRIGLIDLLKNVADVWEKERQKLTETAQKTSQYLTDYSSMKIIEEEPTEDLLDEAFIQLLDSFDHTNGGFGTQPKFPTPHNLLFLLRHWKRKGTRQALEMVEKTLQSMRRGGIYDQIGFGFHRYSTDTSWIVPHFEKMLYDQALTSMAYIEANQVTGKKEYQKTAEEIFKYVLRNMTHPEGGFYSAEDADSEGEEGKFYLWTAAEIKEELADNFAFVKKIYDISIEGNYIDEIHQGRTGKNILHLKSSPELLEAELGMEKADFIDRLEEARQDLFDARERRVHPAKDDKILTNWNGLMIAAFAKAAQTFDQPKYSNIARKAAEFILKNMKTSDGRLMHRFRDREVAIAGNVDDYAFFILGLVELYEATFIIKYLSEAVQLQEVMNEHFWDTESGGFFFTADDSEQLLIRQKEVRDGAVPSGNSIGLLNLVRLARSTGETDFESKAAQMAKALSSEVAGMPSQNTMFLTALDFLLGPSYEIVIAGDPQAQNTINMLKVLRTEFIPNKIIHLKATNDSALQKLASFTQDIKSIDKKATAYVCRNFACSTPTTDINQLRTMIKNC